MEFIVILPLVFLVVFVAAGTVVSLGAKRRAGPLPPADRWEPTWRAEHDEG